MNFDRREKYYSFELGDCIGLQTTNVAIFCQKVYTSLTFLLRFYALNFKRSIWILVHSVANINEAENVSNAIEAHKIEAIVLNLIEP